MGMSAEEEDATSPKEEEWPEVEKAEKLARGAALKWASGVFYRPDQLEGLGLYRIRELQRNSSIQSRIKSTVQSYLEGMSMGLEQLHSAMADVHHVRQALESVQQELVSSTDAFQRLQPLREVALEHAQLGSVVRALPRLFSVHELLSESFDLLQRQQLLEAHAGLMDLESLRDDILSRLHKHNLLSPSYQASVESYFGGLQELSEALAQQLWRTVANGMRLMFEDPSLFVSALRIIEREEGVDSALLQRPQAPGFLPPGRPKGWRQKFFQVLQDTVVVAHFQTVPSEAQGQPLPKYLASLQSRILAELCIVKDLMVQCCPPHYNIINTFVALYHQGLTRHLHQILSQDLDKQEIFAVLHWALHVYPSAEMMAHPSLLPEVDVSVLGPLLAAETVDYLEETYVTKVQANLGEWMQKTLEMEFKEWFSEMEPESDYEGCFQTTLPIIAMKMLDENIRVASLVSDELLKKVHSMALAELESFLGSLTEALTEFDREHQQEPTASKCYAPYLLSTINNCLALSTSISNLCTEGVSLSEPSKTPSSLNVALEKAQKKACRLLLDDMLEDLQPLFAPLLSRQWLSDSQMMHNVCEVIDTHVKGFFRARKPFSTHLLSDSEHLVMSQYVKALLQKKMVCRNAEERNQMGRRMLQDASQLTELFCTLGLEESDQTLKVIADLQELIILKDPTMLSLIVPRFVTKYPDISDDHVSMLLEVRGDVSKEIRNLVLEIMAQNPQVLPENFQPIFSNILVPAPELPFCLGKPKCA
ncbi:exocyst complex component 3-like protein [Eublepharis macularius]|uniref:Exocyst complex component 3-like protein n=1 Tax=Eublepharis macularius TaxID=481883 RepID=A0AA97LIH7_EUBMA|nr:exocyst complex component 3-like protein [Eublepharis macularius]